MSKGDVCVMFSGGVDTALAAVQLLETGEADRLHLLTFCNGLCVRVDASKVHVDELRKKFGADRIVHEIIYVADILEEVRSPLAELIRKYQSTLIFDLCCRLSFETASIIYCVNNDIKYVACGTNIDQGKLFLETPAYLQVAKEYFAAYGIDYFSPVYARSGGRQARMDRLRDKGLSIGPAAFEKLNITSSLFHQPFCLFGIHTFFFTSFARNLPGIKQVVTRFNLSTETAIEARLDRQEIAHRIIADRTASLSPDDDIQEIRIQERFCTTRLCGQNAVELTLPRNTHIDVAKLASVWSADGEVVQEGNYLQAQRGKVTVQVFANGRVVVTGTKDRKAAVSAYEEQVAAHDVFSVA